MYEAHFQGRYEAELKYRLPSRSQFLEQIQAMPHEIMFENNTDTDWYFDTPDRALEKQGKSLCIRQIEPAGMQLWIVKGPGRDRCETTSIKDIHRAHGMLKTMGYQQILKLTKKRSIYFLHRYHITLDYLEGHGDFAEFAIVTDRADQLDAHKSRLRQLAAEFGLTDKDREMNSYKTLASQTVKTKARMRMPSLEYI